MNAPVRLALADDQALIRHGLRAVLQSFAGIQILIDAEDGEQLLQQLRRVAVDVIVMDVRMPKVSGIEATRALREQGNRTPVILLTTFDEPELLRQATAAGAQGFLLKDVEPEELHAAIRRVVVGETLPRTVPVRRLGGGAYLTERELEVLRLVAGGYANKEIGRLLLISGGTVKNHLSEILRKLEARDRTHAVLKAIANGLM